MNTTAQILFTHFLGTSTDLLIQAMLTRFDTIEYFVLDHNREVVFQTDDIFEIDEVVTPCDWAELGRYKAHAEKALEL